MTERGRFEFGKNWSSFLAHVDEKRIQTAIQSLQDSLGITSLENKKVLDIGSGSGLFSLAAHRLGAEVTSIDYDTECVACTQELKRMFGDDESPAWTIHQGSVLDEKLMTSLGEFDVVYSWGVLHHTGNMDKAIELAKQRVAKDGWFFIAIYNDQGNGSRRWLKIKTLYNKLPSFVKPVYVAAIAGWYECQFIIKRALQLKNPLPNYNNSRGMTVWYDWVDWVGGLPFEVATPEQIILPLHKDGFFLTHLKTINKGWGCHEFVFQLKHDPSPSN